MIRPRRVALLHQSIRGDLVQRYTVRQELVSRSACGVLPYGEYLDFCRPEHRLRATRARLCHPNPNAGTTAYWAPITLPTSSSDHATVHLAKI